MPDGTPVCGAREAHAIRSINKVAARHLLMPQPPLSPEGSASSILTPSEGREKGAPQRLRELPSDWVVSPRDHEHTYSREDRHVGDVEHAGSDVTDSDSHKINDCTSRDSIQHI